MVEKVANKKTAGSELRETIVVIVEALLIALVIRTFLFHPFSVYSGSMQSTMMIGDYYFASKFAWGYGRYTFPYGIVPMTGRVFGSLPERGDIALFHNAPSGEEYVKRIVGLPGDVIQMKDGVLFIDGKPVKRERIGRGTDKDRDGMVVPVTLYTETLPNGVTHTIQEIADNGPLDNTGVYKVPEGHYFMMGDNRDRSLDSRVLASVGYVPLTNLIGKAEVSFFSIVDDIPPWQIWRWWDNVRLDRMFRSVYQ